MPYSKFTEGATAQHGLFTIWRKDGNVAIELKPDQFGTDYVELGVPVNGIGAGLFSGITDLQNCRILRFVKQDNRVAILFPTTRFLAAPNSPEAQAVAAGTTSKPSGRTRLGHRPPVASVGVATSAADVLSSIHPPPVQFRPSEREPPDHRGLMRRRARLTRPSDGG